MTSLSDREVKEYEVYKLIILFFALIDQLYVQVFASVPVGSVELFCDVPNDQILTTEAPKATVGGNQPI